MKVIQSTLSMEAHSLYRDVRLAGSAAIGQKTDTVVDRDQLFRLDFRQKTESLNFCSTGNVETEDGREIDVSFNLSIERSSTYAKIDLTNLTLLDPLVLSFSDGLSPLSGSSFSFDLDGDGSEDDMGELSCGSGFLAIDLNGDDIINDGSELFGPKTGDGFRDLAEYDLDHNLWIDENDPVFDELLVWMEAGGEASRLISLREAGVGAISLTSAASDFILKSSNGEVLGRIASTGLFLMEDGQPRSLQEIDCNLRVEELQAIEDSNISSVNKVVAKLQQIIMARRRQVHQLLFHQFYGIAQRESHEDRLSERFWDWQTRGIG